MAHEGSNQDLKKSCDFRNPKAKLSLVKDIVAIANSGGGQIIFGRTELEITGLDTDELSSLDSAKMADLVDNYIAPFTVRLSHTVEEPLRGKHILILQIQATETPLVISRDGIWIPPGKKYEEFVLRMGEVWLRHSSKNERATSEDLRSWINAARSAERAAILERVGMLVNLPEGSDLRVIASTGSPIETPSQLLQTARDRLEWDPDHLLSADELFWIYSQRASLTLSNKDLHVLIASSLRKSATLHYWVALADHDPQLVVLQLKAVLVAGDRDKSDAGRNVVELAAFYADEQTLRSILDGLRTSAYKHFREAAEEWKGRIAAQRNFFHRLHSASHNGKKLSEYEQADLDQLASELALRASRENSSILSRRLSDVNRVIWARRTGRSQSLQKESRRK